MALTDKKFPIRDGAPAGGIQDLKDSQVGETDSLMNMSTGIVDFDGLSVNADDTKFDHGDIEAQFVDNTVPGSEAITRVTVAAATAIVDAFLLTNIVTYIGVNVSGTIVQQGTPFTFEQRRTIADLGRTGHPGMDVILGTTDNPTFVGSPLAQVHDILQAIGTININGGNFYSANGTDLELAKSEGQLLGVGIGFNVNKLIPNIGTIAAEAPVATIFYGLRDGTVEVVTDVIPDFYDLAGVKTAVPIGKVTTQLIALSSGGATLILYGQTLYDNLDDAKADLFAANYVIPDVLEETSVLRTALVVTEDATDLSDPADAYFKDLGKFGGAF